MKQTPRILVLMTTYNGERYVREQLDSILAQEDVDVDLRVCDDCSTDRTFGLLTAYAADHPQVQVQQNNPNKGVIRNFMDLVYGAPVNEYDYFAISDQDDVWLPNKLQVAAQHIDADSTQPQLYYSDVTNVDNDGNVLGNEYAPYKRCAEHPASLLLVQNWCLGCTMLMNGALVKQLKAHPVYDFERMYDAWIHAVALYCGGKVVADLDHSYIRRRISGQNVVGVMNEKRSAGFIVSKALKWLVEGDEVTARKHSKMAEVLHREFADQMDAETAYLVKAVADRTFDAKARRYLFRRKDIVMTTSLRTAWLRWMVLFNRF